MKSHGEGGTPAGAVRAKWLCISYPSTHFVRVAQAILYRGAGFDIVWPEFAATAAIGAVCFVGALLRFRKALTAMQM